MSRILLFMDPIIENPRFFFSLSLLFIFCQNSTVQDMDIDPNLAQPETTIRHYWAQLAKHNYREALKCFVDFSGDQYSEADVFPLPELDSLRIDSIVSIKIAGKNAEIHYRIAIFSSVTKLKLHIFSGDKLVLTKNGWKIKDVIVP